MKKLLLASTALVASAGFAAADVAISGSAEMGIKQEAQTVKGTDTRVEYHIDTDVNFKMSGESDNGISFGASVDLDESEDGLSSDANEGFTVFVSSGAAKLTMGDTDGAFDKALTEVNVAAGSIADDETAHAGFSGNAGLDGSQDGQVARFDYSFSGVTLSISSEVFDADSTAGNKNAVNGLGVAYSADLAGLTLGVGLGFQKQVDNASIVGLSVNTTFANGLKAALNVSETDYETSGLKNQTHAALGLGYEANGLAIGVNFGEYTNFGGTSGATASGAGLAVSYDLGGGLSAQLGYGSSSLNSKARAATARGSYDSWSLGLAMSF